VRVDGERVAGIDRGLLLLAGIGPEDGPAEVMRIARKCAELRIFPDQEGRFARSLLETGGEALVVSQFTLLADTRRGRRPSFTAAAPPETAEPLVRAFADALREVGIRVAEGRFGARMEVELVNDGPVTIVLDSTDFDRPRRG
jgi:D-tyrosyl-tRNA(Tyr) deacylase